MEVGEAGLMTCPLFFQIGLQVRLLIFPVCFRWRFSGSIKSRGNKKNQSIFSESELKECLPLHLDFTSCSGITFPWSEYSPECGCEDKHGSHGTVPLFSFCLKLHLQPMSLFPTSVDVCLNSVTLVSQCKHEVRKKHCNQERVSHFLTVPSDVSFIPWVLWVCLNYSTAKKKGDLR
jgi:hypothetical protein